MIARAVLMAALCVLPTSSEFLTETTSQPAAEEGIWVDLYSGDEISYDALMNDLQAADVVYLGESHDSGIHHHIHEMIMERLCTSGLCPVLVMEQIEREKQSVLDSYRSGQITFEEFAEKSSWAETWSNWADYKGVMEKIRACGGSIAGANAPEAVISKVSRTGIVSLDPGERKMLPDSLDLDSPAQKKLLDKILSVHSFMTPERKPFMFEAQACRDETMAETVAGILAAGASDGKKRIVIVLAGSMHVRYGFGVPDRVRKRAGAVRDRIVLVSGATDSGRAEGQMARRVEMTHDDYKTGERPAGDYVYIIRQQD